MSHYQPRFVKDSLGAFYDYERPSLETMKDDILSATFIEDKDVILVWESIFIGEQATYLSKDYGQVLTFRAKGLSPHNRIKFSRAKSSKTGFFYNVIKTVIVDEDKWYE